MFRIAERFFSKYIPRVWIEVKLKERYRKSSILIALQLTANKWHTCLDKPTVTDAFLDRLTAILPQINLKGKSKRNKDIIYL